MGGPNPHHATPYTNPITGHQTYGNPSDTMKDVAARRTLELDPMTQKYGQQVGQAANAVNTKFSQFTPTLNTNFQPQGGLDTFSKQLLSQGEQTRNNMLAGRQAEIASTFGANNPAARVLQQQAAFTSNVNANPALFQVGAQQVERQQQAARLENEARLAQQQANINPLIQENQAQQMKVGMQSLPLAAQGSLIQALQSGYKK